ncbi:MAG: electron transfer flavoprotein subunit alpha/FixB family protein [Flavobacteriales bacterium]
MAVLVFAEASHQKLKKAALEAIYYGSNIAGKLNKELTVLVAGKVDDESIANAGKAGANKVLHANHDKMNHFDPALFTKVCLSAIEKVNPEVIIFSHDRSGKAIAPRISARLRAGLVSGAVDFPDLSGGFSVKKNVFSGKAIAEYNILTEKKVISLLPNSVQVEMGSGSASVENFNDVAASYTSPFSTELKVKEVDGEIPLTEAELVVSAGRGLKGPENWGIIEDLAKAVGAATACSRPVSDIGWRPHHEHVGQTGIAIRPNLYIAVGISGAIQHLAGVNGSKVIVVINKDPEAPFFKAADYGVVGDAFEVVPKLTEAFKKFKASNN